MWQLSEREVSRTVRAFATIVLGTGSTVLAVAQLVLAPDPVAFVSSNQVALATRLWAVIAAWLGGMVLAVAILWRTWLLPDRDEWQAALTKLFAPLIVSAFIPILFSRDAWAGRELAYLTYVLAVGLGLERLLGPALKAIPSGMLPRLHTEKRITTWLAFGLVVAMAGYYILHVGQLTNISHIKLATSSSDLAEYDNLFFNALHGHPFRSPAIATHLEDWSTLQGHAEFGLYMLLPFYAISPGAHALLWIQSAIVGLTAIPVFLLASSQLGRVGGVIFAFVYLMMPAVQRPNFYDFHFTPLAMFFVTWLLYFVSRLSLKPRHSWSRFGLYVALVFALLCREDIGIGIAVLGVFLVLKGCLVREGLILTAVASIYFLTMKFGIMPLFGRWWFDAIYAELKADGAKGFGAVILTLVSNPPYVVRTLLTEPKFLYVLHMTVPVLALWLRRPLLWMVVLTGFVSTLLATNRPPMYQSSFQYTYLWIPYVVGASIWAARWTRDTRATVVALLLVASSAGSQLGVIPHGDRVLGGFGIKTFDVSEGDKRRYEQLREIITMIPPDASVAATEAEGPHVSARLLMYSLKYSLGKNPDYLLVRHPRQGGERNHIREALESGRYGVIAKKGPFVLAKKGADTKRNEVLWRLVGGRQ